MTKAAVNQRCAEPSQAHAVPTGHPSLRRCMSAICCCSDTRWHHPPIRWFMTIDRLSGFYSMRQKKEKEFWDSKLDGREGCLFETSVHWKSFLEVLKMSEIKLNIFLQMTGLGLIYHRYMDVYLSGFITRKKHGLFFQLTIWLNKFVFIRNQASVGF